MSSAGNSTGGSRLSNESYPASNGTEAETAESSHRPEDLPTVGEKLGEIAEKYPERSMRPLSETGGRTLRADCLEERETVERTVETGEYETRTVSDTVSRGALPWIGGVAQLLEKHESYRDKMLKLSRGSETRGDYESFLVDMDMSYSEDAASQQYAQMEALERQFIGETYPNGVECEGEYAEPMTLLFSLSASSLEGDEYRPPIDHDRAIRDAWSGSSGSVKRVLRDVLERKCGLESGEYAWHFQSEPHAGGGDASGYSHAHPFVIFDAAAVDDDVDPTDAEMYRPVVAKHVAECEGAEWAGHTLEDAVSVNRPGEIDELASYLSKYLAVGPDQDLLERSPEYLMYAASQFASSTQKYSRSRWATAAIKADRCQQQYMSDEADQTAEHGESVVRCDDGRRGLEFECAECGSPHGIDQSEASLARHRLDATQTAQTARTATAATDGGEAVGDDGDGDDGRTEYEEWRAVVEASDESFGARWRSARSGGRFSSPIRDRGEAGDVEIVGFDRPPEWEPEAIVQTASGEETEIGSPGGTAYGEVVVEGAESITERSPLPYLPPPSVLEGPEPWEGTDLIDESDVRLGLVPPPELVAREVAETTQTGRRVTPKEWRSDWYAARFGESESAAADEPELSERDRERVVELAHVEGVESVPSILGRLGISPSKREVVAEVVESAV